MRPLVLSINAQHGSAVLNTEDPHVDDRRSHLRSSRRLLHLVMRAKAVELSRIVSGPGCSRQPHLLFGKALLSR
jgi:hypothetical protein